ncbi:hypothetical protein B0T17DRAFT_509216 [Bombardia bombarda]|uniref:RING-type domain-containing protein n=1 Tax=Bombardia bombarda TaxID=252184 RepID=A0AA39WV61_9PEZI|nr:hypothetical protein B0T17DRAFT_509216 [Bombardia bombarda]
MDRNRLGRPTIRDEIFSILRDDRASQTSLSERPRAAYPTNSPPREEASLWFKVRKYLEADEHKPGEPMPFVTCPLCLTAEIEVAGLLSTSADAEPELGVYLFCGHMLCKACWTQVRDTWDVLHTDAFGGRYAVPPRCPICRHDLVHEFCRCIEEATPIPVDEAELPTLGELCSLTKQENGVIERTCEVCLDLE